MHLGLLSSLADEHARVRAHATVNDTYVWRQHRDFLHRAIIDKGRPDFLFRGDHNPIRCFDAERGGALVDGIQGILDLHELAAWTERRKGERILRSRQDLGQSLAQKACYKTAL